MKLYYDRKSKNPTYFIQQSYRANGKSTTRNVARIGRHSDLLEITDDPLAYARRKVQEANEELKRNEVAMEVKADFTQTLRAQESVSSGSALRNIGYLFIQALCQQLGIGEFFRQLPEDSVEAFDPGEVWRFLLCDRILAPASRRSAADQLPLYYGEPQIPQEHILRTLDLMGASADAYLCHLDERSKEIIGEDFLVCSSDFPLSPQDPEHLMTQHLLSLTALLICRLMKAQLDHYGREKDPEISPFTIDAVVETLKNMNVFGSRETFYTAVYGGSQILTALNNVWPLGLDYKYYLPKDLNKQVRKLLA